MNDYSYMNNSDLEKKVMKAYGCEETNVLNYLIKSKGSVEFTPKKNNRTLTK